MYATETSIAGEIGKWPGVSVEIGRFDERIITASAGAFGVIRTDGVVEVRFDPPMAEMLIELGRAEPAESGVPGWVSVRSGDEASDRAAVELLLLSRDRIAEDEEDPGVQDVLPGIG